MFRKNITTLINIDASTDKDRYLSGGSHDLSQFFLIFTSLLFQGLSIERIAKAPIQVLCFAEPGSPNTERPEKVLFQVGLYPHDLIKAVIVFVPVQQVVTEIGKYG